MECNFVLILSAAISSKISIYSSTIYYCYHNCDIAPMFQFQLIHTRGDIRDIAGIGPNIGFERYRRRPFITSIPHIPIPPCHTLRGLGDLEIRNWQIAVLAHPAALPKYSILRHQCMFDFFGGATI